MKFRNKLLKLVKEKLSKDNTGHSMCHHLRTEKYALTIAKNDKNIDKDVLSAAALIHDVGRIDEFRGIDHVETGVKFAKQWLPKIGFPKEKIPKVIEAVAMHEQRHHHINKKPIKYKETLIIQDADSLDFVGAIGIARGFQFAGAHNLPLYDPKYNVKQADSYKPLMKTMSELHIIKKMLVKNNFNTKTAEKLAKKRRIFVKNFINQFINEWESKA